VSAPINPGGDDVSDAKTPDQPDPPLYLQLVKMTVLIIVLFGSIELILGYFTR
jgi:hypothetical protein